MAGTLKLTYARVGQGGNKRGDSVRRVQELLIAAGESLPKFGADGDWGSEAATALESFQKTHRQPVRPYVEANDPILLVMAAAADVLIQLPGVVGATGVKAQHQTFNKMNTKYNDGAEHGGGNRGNYGVEGQPQWAIQTFYDKDIGTVIKKGPVLMDCTTYVNLMLSVYLFGNAHNNKYDARCREYGAGSNKHCARERYSFPLVERQMTTGGMTARVNYFKTADEIRAATEANPTGLYVLEVAGNVWDKEAKKTIYGAVTHMALLLDSRVYECTTHQVGCACIDRTLDEFMEKKKGILYLFGPAP